MGLKFSSAFPVAALSKYKIDDSGRLYQLTVRPHQQDFYDHMVESVRSKGVNNPVCIHARPDGTHIRLGGTRLLACRELGIKTLPAYVLDSTGQYDDLPSVDKPTNSHSRYEGDFYWQREKKWPEIQATVGL